GGHESAERLLGTAGVARRPVGHAEAVEASRAWGDADADDYLGEHGDFLGDADFVWCPEGLREQDAHLLGDVAGKRVLEVGCGAAMCARWLTSVGADAVAMDLSGGMLRRAGEANRRTGLKPPLVQADAARLPFASGTFDSAWCAFGAVPFTPDLEAVVTYAAPVLRPTGRWVSGVTLPMRCVCPDDSGRASLWVVDSHFDGTRRVEIDEQGRAPYVAYLRTPGDYIRALRGPGFVVDD